MSTVTDKVKRNPHIITRKINAECIGLDLQEGKLYRLNETAEFIWGFIAQPKTSDEIAHAMQGEFDISLETAQEDTNSFIKEYASALFVLEQQS